MKLSEKLVTMSYCKYKIFIALILLSIISGGCDRSDESSENNKEPNSRDIQDNDSNNDELLEGISNEDQEGNIQNTSNENPPSINDSSFSDEPEDNNSVSTPEVQYHSDPNVNLGFRYWNETFKINNRFNTPEPPHDCSSFDEVYYVNGTLGNDTNIGTTVESPFKTINQAVGSVSPELCSLIRVAPGVYNEALDFDYGKKNKTTVFGEDRENTFLKSMQHFEGFQNYHCRMPR